jgi:N-acylneuraminate cytidylyltransferase/CMP-N,N'-diacetyllegionaminic acid synthase
VKILALIPARGGSKRLPRKNVKSLGGLPLIAWTIRAAMKSGACSSIIVSTDDAEIAAIARDHGVEVPWTRPPELASDTASSVDVALHALAAHEAEHGDVDGLLLLQPTSPFRTAESIRAAVRLFVENAGSRSVVSLAPAPCHPAWTFQVSGGEMRPFLGWEQLSVRSQDLEPAFTLDGSLYIVPPRMLRERRAFIGPDTLPFTIANAVESIDIDTPEDWSVAESLLERSTALNVNMS